MFVFACFVWYCFLKTGSTSFELVTLLLQSLGAGITDTCYQVRKARFASITVLQECSLACQLGLTLSPRLR